MFVRAVPFDRAISAVLPAGCGPGGLLSDIMRMSGSDVDDVMAMASPIIGDLLKEHIRQARALEEAFQGPDTKIGSSKKFSFSMTGGGVDDFKAGVTGRVGEPRDDLEKGMEIEHTGMTDSDIALRSGNYGILTTPRREYEAATRGYISVSSDPRILDSEVSRVLRHLDYYGTFSESGKLLDSPLPLVKKANMTRGEIVAIILYTGPAFQLYNAIIRGFGTCGQIHVGVEPVQVVDRMETAGHKFSSTIHLIVSGVEKLKDAQDCDANAWLYRGLDGGELPPAFWEQGFSEFAFMSMTTSLDVAIDYSGIKKGKTSTVLATRVSLVDRGAFLTAFSQFPGEEECLWNPLSYIQREGDRDEYRPTLHGLVRIVYVKINANGRALTVEELQARRKNVCVSSKYVCIYVVCVPKLLPLVSFLTLSLSHSFSCARAALPCPYVHTHTQ